MRFNVLGIDDRFISRLVRQNEIAQRQMQPYRRFYRELTVQYAGANYAKGGRRKTPLNQISLYVSIMLRQLVASTPRVMVMTPHTELKAVANMLELHVNQTLRNMGLAETVRRATLNALMMIGVVRIGLAEAGTVRINGNEHVVGQLFADTISPHDYVCDLTAESYEQRHFEGVRIMMPLEQVRQSAELVTPELMEALRPAEAGDKDVTGQQRTSAIGRTIAREERLEEEVGVWEFYLPQRGIILMLPESGQSPGEVLPHPIRIREWTGPRRGPYKRLGFEWVPDNIMPKSPLSDLYDLNDFINSLAVKQMRQAAAQKQLIVLPHGHGDSAKTIANAPDGSAVTLSDPQRVSQAVFGGIHPPSVGFMMQLIQEYNRHAGNPDLLGGLGPQSRTAKQDELLNENINRKVDDMRRAVVDFVREIAEDVAWYSFTDPLLNSTIELRSRSGMTAVPVTFTARNLRGDFLDYHFRVNPYSMQELTPGGQVQTVTAVLQNLILPYAQIMMSQQLVPDFREIIELIAQRANLPEILRVVQFRPAPTPELAGGKMNQPTKPPVTERRYVRENRPGATSQGKRAEMIRIMMGADSQDAELAQWAIP